MAKDIVQNETADALEKAMLDMPQTDCPVQHFFGPGVYIREIFIPAGTVAVGHHHKTAHLTIVLKGRIAFPTEDGPVIVEGPATFLSHPGRKVVYALTDAVVQNVLGTDETDIEKIENEFIDKSKAWIEADEKTAIASRTEEDTGA